MKYLPALLLLLLCACSREEQRPSATNAPANSVTTPVSSVSLDKLYAIVSDEEMPVTDRDKLYQSFDKAYIEWDCLLGDQAASGQYMLYPHKDAIGGIRVVPPAGWSAILRDLNRLTPLKVKGVLVHDFNGLHVEASSIDLPNLKPAGSTSQTGKSPSGATDVQKEPNP